LDELGWSVWPNSSYFCSLVSRVASSVRAYLLAMANIASDILGFFMVSLRIKDRSLKNGLWDDISSRFVIDLRDDISLVAKSLDELSKGLSFLLNDSS
jgi:hypothetical protein